MTTKMKKRNGDEIKTGLDYLAWMDEQIESQAQNSPSFRRDVERFRRNETNYYLNSSDDLQDDEKFKSAVLNPSNILVFVYDPNEPGDGYFADSVTRQRV